MSKVIDTLKKKHRVFLRKNFILDYLLMELGGVC